MLSQQSTAIEVEMNRYCLLIYECGNDDCSNLRAPTTTRKCASTSDLPGQSSKYGHHDQTGNCSECDSSVYNRYPQMILVGFAETVVDAPSLQHCFDKQVDVKSIPNHDSVYSCLNSRQRYGFKCASGMYYFEVNWACCNINLTNKMQEPQLNCILNTEDRSTQPDLFTVSQSCRLGDRSQSRTHFIWYHDSLVE